MINNAVRCPSGMVMVFDERGEQVPGYQGWYDEVKADILRDAPPDVIFSHYRNTEPRLKDIPKEEW